MYFIVVDKINGRKELVLLAEKLNERGYNDRVEYYQGDLYTTPHFRFVNEDDAIAYSITFGGEISTEIPVILKS